MQLTHILALDVNGRFAINLVDNLVVIHHQSSKTSVVFDILWNQRRGPGANDMAPIVHHPVVAPLPLAPARVPARDPVPGATTELCELCLFPIPVLNSCLVSSSISLLLPPSPPLPRLVVVGGVPAVNHH